MRGTKRLVMWLQALTAKRRVERELDEEMRFHIEMEAEKHARRGVSPSEARRRASLAFGSVEAHKEAMREGRGARGVERAAFDVRFALRQLRKTPGFTAAAVLTLALGIGGNAAVFSVVNGVLLRPLAYPEPDRVVSISHRTRGGELPARLPNSSATHTVYQTGSRSFDAMALYTTWQGSLTGREGPPEWVDVVAATRSLFDVLRVPPALGRAFTEAEDRPGGPRAVIISHALWRQRFGGAPSAIGRTVTVDGTLSEIVGVMPAGFTFPTPAVCSSGYPCGSTTPTSAASTNRASRGSAPACRPNRRRQSSRSCFRAWRRSSIFSPYRRCATLASRRTYIRIWMTSSAAYVRCSGRCGR